MPKLEINVIAEMINLLKTDPEYKRGFKDNIAMAIKDRYSQKRKTKKFISYEDMHEIANKGADDFIKLLIKKV